MPFNSTLDTLLSSDDPCYVVDLPYPFLNGVIIFYRSGLLALQLARDSYYKLSERDGLTLARVLPTAKRWTFRIKPTLQLGQIDNNIVPDLSAKGLALGFGSGDSVHRIVIADLQQHVATTVAPL